LFVAKFNESKLHSGWLCGLDCYCGPGSTPGLDIFEFL
jgi:hypothetical protein